MAPRSKRAPVNGDGPTAAPPAPVDETSEGQALRDAIIVHSSDGGSSFGYAIPGDCQISPFAWPTVLRQVAGKMERDLARIAD